MAVFTYKQFEDEAKKAGMLEQFSAADLALAQRNPDAGMSILQYKRDYAGATTDEAREMANQSAEKVRQTYGYAGGDDGSRFSMIPTTQSSAVPAYTSRYDAKADELMQTILSRPEFSYNAETDPTYQAYKKQYAREGERATKDTLGAAAAATGGVPSSYAVTAAAQAGNYYAAQAADKVAELEDMAYNRYMNEQSLLRSDLEALKAAEEADYQKYLNGLALANEAEDRALTKANLAGQYGDTSLLEALGINPKAAAAETGLTHDQKVELAQLAWERGDYAPMGELLGVIFDEEGNIVGRVDNSGETEPGGDEPPEDPTIALIKALYPTGVITDAAEWEAAKTIYGLDLLTKAGIKYTGIEPKNEKGGKHNLTPGFTEKAAN